jgi:hypothetical protein
MRHRGYALAFVLFVFSLCAVAKDKKKLPPLPADILQAKTALVIVDPGAGVDAADPSANRLARVNVEQALSQWGRLTPVMEGFTADIVIVVRKGNGKLMQPTIGGTSANGIPPVGIGSTATPDASTTNAGVRWGRTGSPNDPSNTGSQPGSAQPQIEAGQAQDSFVVYRGDKDNPKSSPLDAPAVWRFMGKNALDTPSVPAVGEFRKAIAGSEKLLASGP